MLIFDFVSNGSGNSELRSGVLTERERIVNPMPLRRNVGALTEISGDFLTEFWQLTKSVNLATPRLLYILFAVQQGKQRVSGGSSWQLLVQCQ